MSHTPGPWTVEKGNNALTILAKNYYGVARTYGTGEEDKANARLIAAAPDMLAALKEADEIILKTTGKRSFAVEIAIAKAIGE